MNDSPFPIMILLRPQYGRDVHAARRAYPPRGEAHLATACKTVVVDQAPHRTVLYGTEQATCEACLEVLRRIGGASG